MDLYLLLSAFNFWIMKNGDRVKTPKGNKGTIVRTYTIKGKLKCDVERDNGGTGGGYPATDLTKI